jgi:hypothetical protein
MVWHLSKAWSQLDSTPNLWSFAWLGWLGWFAKRAWAACKRPHRSAVVLVVLGTQKHRWTWCWSGLGSRMTKFIQVVDLTTWDLWIKNDLTLRAFKGSEIHKITVDKGPLTTRHWLSQRSRSAVEACAVLGEDLPALYGHWIKLGKWGWKCWK